MRRSAGDSERKNCRRESGGHLTRGERPECKGQGISEIHPIGITLWRPLAQRDSVPLRRSVALVSTIFFSLVTPVAVAQKERPINPPPMAEQVAVSVPRGGQVEIPLRASGRTPGTVRFLLRSSPTDGTLGAVHSKGRNHAMVLYTHSGAAGSSTDAFRFAAQAVDSPVSAAAEVLISIEDPPARIESERALDFGEAFAGDTVELPLTFRNPGGTAISLRASTKLPWSVSGSGEVVVPPGGSDRIVVAFSANAAGDYTGELTLAGHPAAKVALMGRAREALAFSPEGGLEISTDAGAETRMVVKNLTGSPKPLEFSAPQGVSVRAPESVPPSGEAEVFIARVPGNKAAIQGRLVIRSGGFEKSFPLNAGAAPPMLRLVPAGPIDFGSLGSNDGSVRRLEVFNDGGTSARLEAEIPPGFVVVPQPSTIVIPAGASHSFEVTADHSRSGDFEEHLVISGGPGISLDIGLRGTVPGAAASPPSRGIPTSQLVISPPSASDSPAEDLATLAAPAGFFDLPTVPGELRLGWKESDARSTGYVVQRRAIEFAGDNLPPRIRWIDWKLAELKREQGKVLATIKGVPPDSSWFVRVLAIDPSQKRSAPSDTIRITSPPLPPRPWIAWVLLVVVAMTMGFWIAARVRSVRGAEEEATARRIAGLGG